MKTDTLKKSLLDYAIKGSLTAKFRRENSGLSAFNELEIYNDKIKQKRKDLEKELKTLESKLKKAPTRHCETSAESISVIARRSRSNPQTKQELKSQIQMLKKEIAKCKEITPLFCHTASTCHTDLECSEREVSQNTESKRDFSFATQTQNAVSLENDNPHTPPFTIPNSWAWVKLGDICEIFTGDSINATEKEKNFTHQTSGLNYIATKDLANDTSITYENGIKIPDEFLPSFKIAKANSTLLCIEGGSAGRKVGFLKENVCFGNKLCCFENIFAFSKFVFYFLQSGEFSKEFNSNINGIIGGVKKESIRHFLIPLPPLCEQQEIVKKLDLLVSLANDFAITKENLKRIEKRIEKSLLKLALEGNLSKLYRRSSPTLSAFNEISTYNDKIKAKRKDLEKELKTLESTLKKVEKKDFSPTAQNDKQKTTQSKASLENDKNATCHTEPLGEVSKTTESQLVIFASVGKSFARASECEKSTKELKQILKSQIQSLKKELTKCKEIMPLFNQSHEVQPLKASSGVWGVKGGIRGATSRADEVKPVIRKFKPPCPPLKEKTNNTESTHNEAGESEAPFTIPNSWAWVKLGDICEIVRGGSPRPIEKYLTDSTNGFNWIKISDSDMGGKYIKSTKQKIIREGLNQTRFVTSGSLLLTNSMSFGRPYILNVDGCIHDGWLVLSGFETLAIIDYLYFMLSSNYISKCFHQSAAGGVVKNLTTDKVKEQFIPLPPLQEQEYIVQTLDTLFTLKKGLRIE